MDQATSTTTLHHHLSRTQSATGKQFRWLLAIILTFIFVTCFLREFVLPHAPVMFWSDQMLFASDGARIVAGQMPYRDYFQFVTPGADLVYAFLFRHLGLLLWIPNALMVCLAVTGVLLMTLAARKVLHGNLIALPAALTVGFILFGGLDATHHWFSGLIALLAMLVLFPLSGESEKSVSSEGSEKSKASQDWRIVLTGALCGLAASFTQSKGATVTAGFLLYLLWQAFDEKQKASVLCRRCLLLCGAALVVFLAINGPYMAALGMKEWIKWLIVFPFRYYPTLPAQTWRSPIDDFRYQTGFIRWICIPFVYLTIPLVYLIFLRVMYRRRRVEPDQPWNQLLLLAITGLALFLAVAPCLSVMRVSCAGLPGMVLLTWLLNRWGQQGRVTAAALATLSLAIAVYLPVRNQTMRWHYLDLPAGRTAILDPNRYELYRWMAENTHPGQMYFGVGPLALPLWLQTPAPISAPIPYEYDRPEHIAASIAAIESNRVPLLLLKPYRYLAGSWGYTEDHLRPFQAYLDQHYRYGKTFPAGFEVWERNDSLQPDPKRAHR